MIWQLHGLYFQGLPGLINSNNKNVQSEYQLCSPCFLYTSDIGGTLPLIQNKRELWFSSSGVFGILLSWAVAK